MRLEYPGPNHAEGNSFIHAPGRRVLMLVDVIFAGWVPFSNLSLSAFVPGVLRAHEQALSYDFDHFVGGHVRLGGADVFTLPNAWAMAESLRLDLNSLGPFSTVP